MPYQHDALLARIAEMQTRIEELEAENGFMREQLAIPDAEYMKARRLGMRPWVIPAMRLFMVRQFVSHYALIAIADEMEWSTAENFPSFAVHELRKHLNPKGIKIESVWGLGYQVSVDDQARLNALVH